jgi:hypothetical protein
MKGIRYVPTHKELLVRNAYRTCIQRITGKEYGTVRTCTQRIIDKECVPAPKELLVRNTVRTCTQNYW